MLSITDHPDLIALSQDPEALPIWLDCLQELDEESGLLMRFLFDEIGFWSPGLGLNYSKNYGYGDGYCYGFGIGFGIGFGDGDGAGLGYGIDHGLGDGFRYRTDH